MNAQLSPDRTPLTAGFLAAPHKLFINGEWVAGAVGQDVRRHQSGDGAGDREGLRPAMPRDIDLAVKAARKAFESGPWPSMPPSGAREAACGSSRRRSRRTAMRSPRSRRSTTACRFAVARFVGGEWCGGVSALLRGLGGQDQWRNADDLRSRIITCTRCASRWAWSARSCRGISRLRWRCAKIAPALAAGCTVVLKPAELTPLTRDSSRAAHPASGLSAGRGERRHGVRRSGGQGARRSSGCRQDLVHGLDAWWASRSSRARPAT